MNHFHLNLCTGMKLCTWPCLCPDTIKYCNGICANFKWISTLMVLKDVISSRLGILYRHSYSYRYLGLTQSRKNVNSNHYAKFGDTLMASCCQGHFITIMQLIDLFNSWWCNLHVTKRNVYWQSTGRNQTGRIRPSVTV